jgi:hypothetical protein
VLPCAGISNFGMLGRFLGHPFHLWEYAFLVPNILPDTLVAGIYWCTRLRLSRAFPDQVLSPRSPNLFSNGSVRVSLVRYLAIPLTDIWRPTWGGMGNLSVSASHGFLDL